MGHPCPVCDSVGAVLLCHGTGVGQSRRVMDSCRTVLPCNGTVVGQSCSVMGQQWDGPALSWTEGVDDDDDDDDDYDYY